MRMIENSSDVMESTFNTEEESQTTNGVEDINVKKIAEEHLKRNMKKQRVFNFELNEKKAKKKLLDGAMKPNHMDIEIKTTCVNMRFDDGSFTEVVLPLLRNWHSKVDETFEFMDCNIKVIESDAGEDNIKNHIDTKMVILFNTQRIVLHAYNGTRNLMVQGKYFENFALNILEPYFSKMIEESGDRIVNFNNQVKNVLGRPNTRIKNKRNSKKFNCTQCKVKSSTLGDLRMHLKSSHSAITKKKISVKSLVLDEDLTLSEESSADKDDTVNELHPEKPVIEGDLNDHLNNEHMFPEVCQVNEAREIMMINHIDEDKVSSEVVEDDKNKIKVVQESPKLCRISEFNQSLRESVIICGLCAKGFETENTFNAHLHNHTPEAKFECPKCEVFFKSEVELEWHKETEHSKNTESTTDGADDILVEIDETCFKCEDCNFVGNNSELRKHLDTRHTNKIQCEDCDNEFTDEDTLNKHRNSKHNYEPFPCELCGLVLANFTVLQEHVSAIHTHKPCRFCNFQATSKEDMETHYVEVHEEYVILHTMAKEVNEIHDKLSTFEAFKNQVSTFGTFMADILIVLKSLMEGQNAMKQELFITRNNNHRRTFQNNSSNTNNDTKQVPPPAPSSPSLSPTCPPPHPASPSRPRASTPKPKSQILIVGDSITNSLDTKVIAKATDAKISKVKAYSSVHDEVSNIAKEASKFPHLNFETVCQKELDKTEFDVLVLQAGSVDITNLNTRGNATEHFEYFNQEVNKSAENLFNVAESSLRNHSELKKVVIMKQTPRYDEQISDPLQIKPALAEIYNTKLSNLWVNSSLKDKIFVGSHESIACTGGIREARYRCTQSKKFDGIHLYGPSGMKTYTNSVIQILKGAALISADSPPCLQFQHQSRVSGVRQASQCHSWIQDRDIRRRNTRSRANQNRFSRIPAHAQKQFQSHQSYNRYEVLSDSNQGNY